MNPTESSKHVISVDTNGSRILEPASLTAFFKHSTTHCLKIISLDLSELHLPSRTLTRTRTNGYPRAGPHVKKSSIVSYIASLIYWGRDSSDRLNSYASPFFPYFLASLTSIGSFSEKGFKSSKSKQISFCTSFTLPVRAPIPSSYSIDSTLILRSANSRFPWYSFIKEVWCSASPVNDSR